ncbi:MAG: divalent-cation tolerance protein CutA [Candidatus Aenigmarchaeota archaeon]|nr:divalent-cation tolerance protein CutA [Candidatus Aenigmarchaeota archaeon]
MPLIFAYITCPSKNEAKRIAKILLDKKLIACAVITKEVDSLFWWKNKTSEEKEFLLIAKTDNGKFGKIVEAVEKIHPYDVPCIIKIPITANKKYEKWVKDCVKK